MKYATLMLALLALLFGSVEQVKASSITYDLTWSGASYGNSAMATGQITLNLSAINNPGTTYQNSSPFVTAFSITVTGASSGNGTFGLGDYTGSVFDMFGGFELETGSGMLDFTQQLVGQPTTMSSWGTPNPDGSGGGFNIFSNDAAPFGVLPFTIQTNGADDGDDLLLTSFQPVAPPVPEPASITLLGIGIASLAGYRWRRRLHFMPI